ncbi:hypothetical protein [Neomegalonema perideroedes]|uniref:hypothetical protein n=1 Tax=Neomegalonema perideroedes TaxID=217219 RepID=UPI00036C6849|nr:hypothetical protein [Neomegalonema perideroedes]
MLRIVTLPRIGLLLLGILVGMTFGPRLRDWVDPRPPDLNHAAGGEECIGRALRGEPGECVKTELSPGCLRIDRPSDGAAAMLCRMGDGWVGSAAPR